jgi:beta-lactamase class A
MIGRRQLIGGAAVLAAGLAFAPLSAQARYGLGRIRDTLGPGARLGVAAYNHVTRRLTGLDVDSRYAMCSTFKLPLAAAILARAQRERGSLSRRIRFGAADLLEHAPVVRARLAQGSLTLRELCAAAVIQSDNSAANLLLSDLGGPAALNAFVRACGDETFRLDRYEPDLNANEPGDARDTTCPAAMARLIDTLLFGNVLASPSNAMLIRWLERSIPGRDRLAAGLPRHWWIGHKTGTGSNGANNDVGYLGSPNGPAIAVASFISGGTASDAARAAAHAATARLIVAESGYDAGAYPGQPWP